MKILGPSQENFTRPFFTRIDFLLVFILYSFFVLQKIVYTYIYIYIYFLFFLFLFSSSFVFLWDPSNSSTETHNHCNVNTFHFGRDLGLPLEVIMFRVLEARFNFVSKTK